MKQMKFLFTAIAILAVVGSALAFKTKFSSDYCIATPVNNACPTTLKCTGELDAQDPTGTVNHCYVLKGATTCTPVGGRLCTTFGPLKNE
jgi:hypothetical protein